MNMWKDFKEFAFKGNVMDLAVGVIIGAAFGKIVSSLVNDIIMPLVGLLLGGIDFINLKITVGNSVVKYGNFIQAVVDFFIVGFSIFLFIKLLSNLKKKEQIVEESFSKEEELLTEIRDLLKKETIRER